MAADNGGQKSYAPMIGLDPGAPFSSQVPALKGVKAGGSMFGSIDVYLAKDQEVVADYGSLLWMDSGMDMDTNCYGDCSSAIGRNCAGESMCMNTYKHENGGIIGFGFLLPGDLITCCVTAGNGWILSKGAFVAGSTNIRISGKFAGCCASQFSGEGMFLTKISLEEDKEGPGTFWAGAYGGIDRHVIPGGTTLHIDNGLFFAGSENTKLNVAWAGGLKSSMFGGEGLVMSIRGYGDGTVIFTQNRDPSIFKPPEDTTGGDPFAD